MCDVCNKKDGPIFKNTVHFLNGSPVVLSLCYIHDLELFKKGQSRFMKIYEKQLSPKLGSRAA
jgi:hypothetical protein